MNSEPEMTVREAGRRGGNVVKAKYGLGFYATIGRLGGQSRVDSQNDFVEMGRKGGRAVSAKFAPDHFREIGTKGGNAVKATRGIDYYREIGRKGGNTPKKPRAGQVAGGE